MLRCALLLAAALVTAAQSPQPSFDVASVKENRSANETEAFGIMPATPGRMRIIKTPLRFIFHYAFNVRDHQVIGAPEWVDFESYDITATYPSAPARTEDERRAMLRTLLAERFGLKFHRESRQMPVYMLVLARKDGALGPQLVRSTVDCEQPNADKGLQSGLGNPSAGGAADKRPVCRMQATRRFITASAQPLEQLTGALQAFTGRPVIDRTGLSGRFDFDLRWTSGPIAPAPGAAPSPDDGPSIFAALQEQLGLRLEPERAPFEVVIIDAVQRPTPD